MSPINPTRKSVTTMAAVAALALISSLSPLHAALPSCTNVLSGSRSGSKSIGYGNEWIGITGSAVGSASFRAADCVTSTGLTLKRQARANGSINVDARLIKFTIGKVFNAAASVSAQATGNNASLVVKVFGVTVFSQSSTLGSTFSTSATSSLSKSLDLSLLGIGVKFSASVSLTRSGSLTVDFLQPVLQRTLLATPIQIGIQGVRLASSISLVANAKASASGGVPCARAEFTAQVSKILGIRLSANASIGFGSATGGITLTSDPVTFLLKLCAAICLAPDPCLTLVNTSFGGFSVTIFKF